MLKIDNLCLKLGSNSYHYQLHAQTAHTTAILGKSGSGKSTLLNLIAGFLQPDTGSLSWNEHSLLHLQANQRPVTTLFQQHNLFTHLSVAQNIGLGISPHLKLSKADHLNIEHALSEVGMQGYANTSSANLSGGEQQRVALARCLLRQQPILLLDEPFSALDEHTRHEMIVLTQSVISNHKLCALLVTHNEEDADRLNATKYQLRNGKLAQLLLKTLVLKNALSKVRCNHRSYGIGIFC